MIEINDLTMKFDGFSALDNISLKINKGILGLIGPNGAGKSTLLRLIAGIYKPMTGACTADGEVIFDNPGRKEKIFFINDETVQFGNMTLLELCDFYRGFYPLFSRDEFHGLNETLKLPEKKKMHMFSKGMKRQAIVITGLAANTEYLLLDEAFDGLDPAARILIRRIIADTSSGRDLTTVISSHNLKEIGEICGSAVFIKGGRIISARDLSVSDANIHKIQAVFDNTVTKDDFNLDIIEINAVQSITYMIIRGEESCLREELNKKSPKVLDIIPLSLEEIFIHEMEGMAHAPGD